MATEVPENKHSSAALALYAGVLSASSLDAAAHSLVAAVARNHGFDRVTIGLHRDGRTRLLASSSLDLSNPQSVLPQRLLGTMDESIEQGVSLRWPDDTPTETDDGGWIRLEHQRLQREVNGAVATVALGFDGTPFAALCVERHQAGSITQAELQTLEQHLQLATPALRWMYRGEQAWYLRMRDAAWQWLAGLRDPRRRTTRSLLLAALAAFLFIALVPLEYAVSGKARVEGARQRVLSAP